MTAHLWNRASRHRRRQVSGVVGALVSGIGIALLVIGVHAPGAPSFPASTGAAPSTSANRSAVPGMTHAASEIGPMPRSVPLRLDIPRIGVHTALIALGLNPDGTVMVPPLDAHAPAGWYRYLSSPGEPGPAVVLGHVDTHEGPAVFYRLSVLEPGDRISIRRADGHTAVFAVQSVRSYTKDAFPTEAVYGQTNDPVLRLVTCGGAFDRGRGTYLSNVVVYAEFATRS
jgi:sortase (surface protein transpeptidase)